MFRNSRKRFGNLKCAAKVEKENSCSTYAFVQEWNIQVCRDRLLRYCLYVSARVIKISFTQKLVLYCLWSLFTYSNQSQFCIHEFPMLVLRPGLWVKKHDGLFYFGRSKHLLCAKYYQNHLIFSSFLKKDSETSIQKNFGHVLGNWFLADLVKVISVAVHTSNRGKWKTVIIDSLEKISLDKKNLQIQAKSCDFILNPDFTCSIFLMTGLTSDLRWFSCLWYNCWV